ncbi:unnamed protein product [Thlaspi arvense]|uniref:Uncharacterized protein n=1 Tax=Thlaspi arvense TaxID=13288 RepID=A0AAU9S2Q1_THLAR|nr:unnamed protein product [Thlaspi arvense]
MSTSRDNHPRRDSWDGGWRVQHGHQGVCLWLSLYDTKLAQIKRECQVREVSPSKLAEKSHPQLLGAFHVRNI